MPFTDAGAHRMLDSWAGAATGNPVTYASLHIAVPDNTGSNEVTGGTPAYARKTVGFLPATARTLSKNATNPVFDVPASTSVFFFGFWTAVTGGTFMGWFPCNGASVDGYATVATSDTLTSYAHGLATNDRVVVSAPIGASLPAGLSATTIYHVIGATTDTFQLSTSQGGSAVDITVANELYFQRVIPESYGSQGTFTLGAVDISL